jgi:uncharacterized alpha-E superfamily protein
MANPRPARAMDNLFWLGRYAERTESLVRILRAVTARLGDGRRRWTWRANC